MSDSAPGLDVNRGLRLAGGLLLAATFSFAVWIGLSMILPGEIAVIVPLLIMSFALYAAGSVQEDDSDSEDLTNWPEGNS